MLKKGLKFAVAVSAPFENIYICYYFTTNL